MTTTVKIEAHCSNETEVEVQITDGGKQVELIHLNDGSEAERYVYDGRVISVREKGRAESLAPPSMEQERMLKWFAYEHLPANLQGSSKPFHDLAKHICDTIYAGPERTVALRKLLEAKDAAVRATVQRGG